MEVFWKTIAQYNEATWIFQVIITIAGILLTVLLYQKPTLLIKRLMKGYMVFLNSWISIVYYMIYCGDRNYNYILAIFWGIIALIWLWDLITNYTPFERFSGYGMYDMIRANDLTLKVGIIMMAIHIVAALIISFVAWDRQQIKN